MEEIWKDVGVIKGVDFSGLYMVSNFGNVKSLNYNGTGKEKVLKPSKNKYNGYLQVCLYKKGKRKMYLVHRLVAEAFIPNPNNLPFINHKSEIKSQNNAENLEYCGHLYNCNYGTRNKRMTEKLKGKYNTKTSKPVLQIDKNTNEVIAEFPSVAEAIRQLGYSTGNISACCLGKLKTYKGFIWKYAS